MLASLAIIALNSSNAKANTITQGFEAFYGNVNTLATGTCNFSGTFPVIANFDIDVTSSGTFYTYQLKFLISGASLPTSPQYLNASFNTENNVFRTYDPELFFTTTGITGTYTGSITTSTIGAAGNETILSIGNGSSAPVISTAAGCTISYYGTLYLSPE